MYFCSLKCVSRRLLYLDNREIITLCLSNVGYIILELKAWQVVVDILQD